MATVLKNLSQFESPIPSAENYKVGIVVAEWNWEITSKLLQGTLDFLKEKNCKEENIIVRKVPGTFELTLASQYMFEYAEVDGVVALGCVIQGETRHFEFLCQGVTYGLNKVALEYNAPVAFGVLTVDNIEQAQDRAGGKHGNKGVEAAATLISMLCLENSFDDEQ